MSDVVRIRVRGRSMLPSLSDGEEVEVVLGAPVAAGDVVLFMDGEVAILHRVLCVRAGRVTTQGDGAPRPDAPFDAARILGVARVPRRSGLAMRRRVAELARASVRAILGRRVIAWLRVTRSLVLLLAFSSGIAIAEPTSAPSSPELIELGQQIDNLTDLVRSLPEGDVKAKRMMQLADAYRERGTRQFEDGRAAREERSRIAFEAYQNGAPHAVLSQLPADRLAESDRKKALAIYDFLVKKYPAHPRTEHALESMLLCYLDLYERDKATAVLAKLETYDPSSQALARSYVAVANVELEGKRPADALSHYEKAAAIAEPDLKREAERQAAECREQIGRAAPP